jgi:hypothetical protein
MKKGKLDGLPMNEAATRLARSYLFWFDEGVRCDMLVICQPGELS